MCALDKDAAAWLILRLESVGQFRRDEETGERIPASTATEAAARLRDAIPSREIADLEPAHLAAVRAYIDLWMTVSAAGEVPEAMVALRHALADMSS